MGIYSDLDQIKSFNFFSYNYYKNLSDLDSILYKHNQHYSADKVDLHVLRDAFFKSGFINNLKIEWFVENDSNKHSFKGVLVEWRVLCVCAISRKNPHPGGPRRPARRWRR